MNRGLLGGAHRRTEPLDDTFPMGTEGSMPAQTTSAGATDTLGSAVTWAPDLDPFEMYQGAGIWKVPEGGSGIWIITANVAVTVSGAVTVSRGNIAFGGNGLQANGAFAFGDWEPHGGTNVSQACSWMGALMAGESFHITFGVVSGTSGTATMGHLSAYRLMRLPPSERFQNR